MPQYVYIIPLERYAKINKFIQSEHVYDWVYEVEFADSSIETIAVYSTENVDDVPFIHAMIDKGYPTVAVAFAGLLYTTLSICAEWLYGNDTAFVALARIAIAVLVAIILIRLLT